MAGTGGDQHDRLARPHHADAVEQQDAHQLEAGERLVGQRFHPRQGQRLVMREFERFDAVIAAHFADEGADPAQPRMGVGERADELRRD